MQEYWRTNEPKCKKRSYLQPRLSHSIRNISIGFCLSPLGLRNLQARKYSCCDVNKACNSEGKIEKLREAKLIEI